MPNHEEEHYEVSIHRETREMHDFQPAFDVLKELNLDRHISEEERKFLGVQ